MTEHQSTMPDNQDAYIKQLKPGQFDDIQFVLAEIARWQPTHPIITARLYMRAKRLAQGNDALISKIESMQIRWELDNTPTPEILTQSTHTANQSSNQVSSNWQSKLPAHLQQLIAWVQRRPFSAFVLVPVLIFAIYLVLIATPRYESQAQLLVKQPDAGATMEPSLALLSGMTGGASAADTEVVKAYMFSNDMLSYLDQSIDYSAHFADAGLDWFSRLAPGASTEDRREFLTKHVMVSIDPSSSIITVQAQAFEPEFASIITQTIVDRAEWFINKIGHDLAKAQLSFVQNEHQMVESKLQQAQSRLLRFQRKYNLLDPEAEGAALQKITFQLEGQIAAKSAELSALKSSMSDSAPQVRKATEELLSLQEQLISERNRLTRSLPLEELPDTNDGEAIITSENKNVGVNDILSQFSDYKIDLEFALQAYQSSKISMEKSRIEAYRQLKYLVVVEAPTTPDDAKYPRVMYNTALAFVVLILIFGIGKMIIATADELS